MGDNFPDGQLVFYVHPVEAWVVGTIKGAMDEKTKKYNVQDRDGDQKVHATPVADIYRISYVGILDEDANDLLMLSELHEATVLNTIRRRYMNDVVYTYIGGIVLAINPFNYNIPWYRDDFMPNYLSEGARIQVNKPHSWSVAHNTYHEMTEDRANQTILVSGESGAGKTEAVKIVIKYLGGLCNKLCKNDDERKETAATNRRILLASPILESFGNAKTGRNDNSSRFGKFLQLQFNSGGLVQGSFAINYLLEKSRVLTAGPGERCYHSFYQVAKGKDAAKWGLSNPKDYPSLISGNTIDNASMEDAEGEDLSYRVSNECFGLNGIDQASMDATWKTVAGILLAYRAEFKADSTGERSEFASGEDYIKKACELWGIDGEAFVQELLTFTISLKGETTVGYYNMRQAITARDSLLKTLYKFLFDWLFQALNATTSKEDGMVNWIGLLDIFGFEDFKVNSFEQLCINLANETLQNHYNDYVFEKDMEECRAEGIDITSIVFTDNRCTCELLNDKLGVFAMLDEECALGKGTDLGFLEKIAEKHNGHPSFEKKQLQKTSFTIKHFAGRVNYEVANFLEKNRDSLKDSMKLIFRASTDPIIKILLPEPVEKTGKPPTASGTFRKQIDDLMALINSTNPHWIRCVKPHPAKKPLMFLGQSVMEQMRSSGVLETIRIRKAGYPIRIRHEQFAGRFRVMAKDRVDPKNPLKGCEVLVKEVLKYTADEAQIGKTKVFMRAHVYQDAEEKKRVFMHEFANMVQRFAAARSAGLQKKDIILVHYKPQLDFIEKLKQQRIAFKAEYEGAYTAFYAEEAGAFKALWALYREKVEKLERDKEAIAAWRKGLQQQLVDASGKAEKVCAQLKDDMLAEHAALIAACQSKAAIAALQTRQLRDAVEIMEEEAAAFAAMRRRMTDALMHQAKADEKAKRDAMEAERERKAAAKAARLQQQRDAQEAMANAALDRRRELARMRAEIDARKAQREEDLLVKQHLLWEERRVLEHVLTEDARRARWQEEQAERERLRDGRLRQLELDRVHDEEARRRRQREADQRARIRARAADMTRVVEDVVLHHEASLPLRGGILGPSETERLLRRGGSGAPARGGLAPEEYDAAMRHVAREEDWEARRDDAIVSDEGARLAAARREIIDDYKARGGSAAYGSRPGSLRGSMSPTGGLQRRSAAAEGGPLGPSSPTRRVLLDGHGVGVHLSPHDTITERQRQARLIDTAERQRDMLDRLTVACNPYAIDGATAHSPVRGEGSPRGVRAPSYATPGRWGSASPSPGSRFFS